MRKKQAKFDRDGILRALRAEKLDVECGECGEVHLTSWFDVQEHCGSVIAASEVHCPCGCTLHSYVAVEGNLNALVDGLQKGKRPTPRRPRARSPIATAVSETMH